MCGIAGIVGLNQTPISSHMVRPMCDAMAHRGPDDAGYMETDFLALGHRRLAVIDLSAKAHQPMSDADKTIWITYNGEVYNFRELRKELETLGYVFSSNSDTEVVIYSYKAWGIDCIKRFNGMFAFALWDSKQSKLFLVRDRYGIKPLYYFLDGKALVFASEIKAILQSGLVKASVDLEALNEYFTFQNIFTDRTLFKDIKLLPPASYLQVDAGSKISVTRYWDYLFSPVGFRLSQEEAAEEIRRLFTQAVIRQLVSDVPIGSYLSGGMDTSSVATVAREHLGRISTFTCGFDLSSASGLEMGFDEREKAEFLANLLKTEHYEVVLHAGDMEQVMPELIYHLEDLRMGQSYPNYYIARLAGKFVKVVLSGAGGDELFGGYPWRYYRGANSRDMADYSRKYYAYWQRLVEDKDKKAFFRPEVYRAINGHSTFDVFGSMFPITNVAPTSNESYINRSLYFEAKTFLHGLFLVDDKISMAHSLEMRVPFLDNDLVDFAMKVPVPFKLNNLDKLMVMDEDAIRKYYGSSRDGKVVLRQAMKGLMPKEILERKKQGFSGPDASWFRGESIEYVKGLLLNPKARIYDYINPEYLRQRLEEHISGKFNHRLFIWSLLSFEWWNRVFVS